MPYILSSLTLLIGTGIGAVIVWAFLRSKIAQARDHAFASTGVERATWVERQQQAEYRIYAMQQTLDQERREHGATRGSLYVESERRAAAETRTQRIGELEAELQGRDQAILQQRTDYADIVAQLRRESEQRASAETLNRRVPELERRIAERDNLITELHDIETALRVNASSLETQLQDEQRAYAEKEALLGRAEKKLSDTFAALSADALRQNNASFVQLAKSELQREQTEARGDLERRQLAIDGVVRPIGDKLREFDEKVGGIELKRESAYASLQAQVRALQESQTRLHTETSNLVTALRSPTTRGRWGELQLQRIAEMTGMMKGCDFELQDSVSTPEGSLRPDMTVRLPGDKIVVVDAKTPLVAYLDAVASTDPDERAGHFRLHARHVRDHITRLSEKRYWEQFAYSPEFVVMFLPGEAFFSMALEHDTTLIEFGAAKNVILATPTTFIALMRVIQHGWTQDKMAHSAKEIGALGRDLYERLSTLGEHWIMLGRNLENTTRAYNDATGSLDLRVFTQARRFRDLGAADPSHDLPGLAPVTLIPRISHAPEMQDIAGGD